MKTKKTILILLAVLLCLTAGLAAAHSITRDKVPAGALLLQHGDRQDYVLLEKLPMEEISGVIRNGKGEEMELQEQGVALSAVLRSAGIDSAAVQTLSAVAEDEFSAELSGEEVNEPGKAFLAKDKDGSMKLIVFGDSNSKRNVRNVVKLIVQ